MATVVKDPLNRSPFWYACFTTADGRRLKKSTKETNQSKAKLIAETLQRAEDMAKDRALTEVRTRELLSDVLQRANGEGLRVFTVKQWFEHIAKQKRKSKSEKTALRHEQVHSEFLGLLGSRGDLNIAAITSKDVLDFRDRRESKGLAPNTVNLDITVLSAAFNAALKQGHVTVNPCAGIEPVKDKVAARKETFTPEQVTALVRSADTDDWKGLMLVGFYCGARLGDCANLQWKQIDLASEIKTLRFQQAKTGGEVIVVIHPELEKFLTSLRKQRKVVPLSSQSDAAYVFPSLAQRNISPLSKHFRRKIMERAGIKQHVVRERDESGSGRSVNALTFHSLRHTFNSALANAGIAEETRMALTGHTTREMNQRYTHRELEVFRAAIGTLPQVSVTNG
jgi:integrase